MWATTGQHIISGSIEIDNDSLDLEEPVFFLRVLHDVDCFDLVIEAELLEGNVGFVTI